VEKLSHWKNLLKVVLADIAVVEYVTIGTLGNVRKKDMILNKYIELMSYLKALIED
jgi:hypothetical protein